MDSFEKGLLVIGSFFVILFLGFFVVTAYDGYLRAQVINSSPDPLYAACAYDSGKERVPPSCFTLLTQTKELPR